VIKESGKNTYIIPAYILGIFWISLGSLFYYKTTRFKQTFLNQTLVFIFSPIIFSPVIAITYTIIVILPIYSLASKPGF